LVRSNHSLSLELPRSKEDFRESGYGFGRFASLLSSYPVASLFVSIPHFHDTPKRYRDFLTSVQQDAAHRVSGVAEEIAFFESRRAKISELEVALEKGALPSRVTHNDTKLNNVLLDEATGRALCVIDLDTIMPGSVLFDFGDSIRFGANTAVEDEKDLRKVSLSLPLFQAYAEGYLAGFGKALTSKEKENLPLGAYTMTMECGMRFLSDYLNGDTYFRVAYPEHNLVRAHTQIALAKDMEKKWDQMSILISQIH
jgi:N-acetylhexosamine 1-kinase